ncbi:MAG TPA: SAF domain-containing protein [Solirubrobacterales bacterium]|nr:SAF domain-containing protein [Solirubrobacterales bacterium]
MRRRARALALLLGALLAAATAAALADSYGAGVARGYGELRPVLVAVEDLRAGRAVGPEQAAALETRRVPARFVPPGALANAAEAIGLVPAGTVPAGSYLLASQLRPPRVDPGDAFGLGGDRHPVEIAVSGAEALTVAGAQPVGERVDVVVTAEPTGSGPGRTYVAAAAVPLLALGPGAAGTAAEGLAAATLGLTRPQALRLIAAESFARRVTLLPRT